ncbi:MATE family efflux transporter [Candidatus Cardinium hertigii]|uniref:Multidrug resistance protein MdtK n=1 Tax=Candidatus Cardinium hertigii TaxID=247481 RepID=A0A2Z3L6S9_9BACT|nr:MATE family efflux transporter [Candidatus Cardinium hertigii]AWN81373.1 Multidrug resistance protein MdtK [Candidatus Cardinium hertigii]
MLRHFSSIDRALVRGYLIRTYPIAFSILNTLAMEAINTIVITRMGICFAAYALCINALFNFFKKINTGISVSVSLLTARSMHKKNYRKATQILQHALFLNLFLASVFFLILVGYSFYLESSSKLPHPIDVGQRSYLLLLAIALIPSAVNTMIRRYLEGISREKIGLKLAFLTLIANIIFNFLLCGKSKVPFPGLKGVGISIVLSEMLTAIIGMSYIRHTLQLQGCTMRLQFNQISWRYIKAILSIGGPIGLQFGIEGGYLFLITFIIGKIGMEEQATHAIVFNICQLVTIFSIGLGISGAMYVAQQHRSHNICIVRKVALTACLMIELVSLITGCILLALGPYIFTFYKAEGRVNVFVCELINHLFLFQLFYSISHWGSSVLRGLNDKTFPLICSTFTQLIGISMCYFLILKNKWGINWGINGVWMTLILERMVLSLLLLMRFEWKTKTKT